MTSFMNGVEAIGTNCEYKYQLTCRRNIKLKAIVMDILMVIYI